MEDVEAAEFFGQAFAQAVGGVGFYPAGIGDEADDAVIAFFFDAVRCPADGADVAVVEGVFVGRRGLCGIGLADAFIKMRIGDIGVVVVGGFLSGGIGRVADDDADVQRFLPFAAGAVVHQHFVEVVAFFVHLEGVGEADASKGFVCCLVFVCRQVVVGGFDVDGGDVVGEQDDFVGVYFGAVFLRQASARDDAALQQAGDEGACAGERIKDVHTFILQAAVEFAAQDVFHAVDDEVHDFDRGVNDAEAFGHAWEGVAEEFVVKLDDDFLFARRVVDAFGAHLHGFVEFLQTVAFFVQVFVVQAFEDVLHGEADRVVRGEAVAGEEGIEDGLGNHVLREHFDDVVVADVAIQVVAQFDGEVGEGGFFVVVGGVGQNGVDAVNVGVGDFGDVARPVFPVVAVAAFFDDFGVEGALDFADFEWQIFLNTWRRGFGATDVVAAPLFAQGSGSFAATLGFGLDFVGDGDDFHFVFVFAVEFQFVDHGVEAVIMGT